VNVSSQLREWRERLGLTQAGAAAVLGVSQRAVENWEQGVNQPRGLALRALLQVISEPSRTPQKPIDISPRIGDSKAVRDESQKRKTRR
jgi:transcriptional regulator with XRE-family HTH domain